MLRQPSRASLAAALVSALILLRMFISPSASVAGKRMERINGRVERVSKNTLNCSGEKGKSPALRKKRRK